MTIVNTPKRAESSLINRNIVVNGRRTSVRLEAEMWNDLRDICRREGRTIHELCTLINERRSKERSLTSSIRVFLISYYRSAATEEGHIRAGHGEHYVITNHISARGDGIERRRVRLVSDGPDYRKQ